MKATGPRVHMFGNVRQAYDATQTREDIRNGDVLYVGREGVVGWLFKAWPIAVTAENGGEFHGLTDGTDLAALDGRDYRASDGLARYLATLRCGYCDRLPTRVETDGQPTDLLCDDCARDQFDDPGVWTRKLTGVRLAALYAAELAGV